MAKISTYEAKSSPTGEDYVIGTDAEDSLKTKSFKLATILELVTLDSVLQNGNTTERAIVLNGSVTLGGEVVDSLDSAGTVGQVLTSTGSAVEWQDASGGGGELTRVLTASASDSLQVPAGLDSPLKINFGAAQGTISDPVSINASGTVTFNEEGQYHVQVELPITRQGSGAISYTLVRALLNSSELEPPTVVSSTIQSSIPYKKMFIIDALATEQLEIQIMRDSNGANDGLLSRFFGSGGFGGTPSSYIKIWKA